MADDNSTGTDNKGAGTTATSTFSQADVDRIVRERLAREREKYSDYDDLKARAAEGDKSKSALDKLTEQVQQLNERATKAERAAMRADVASAKKLPAWMAKRLTGNTREELETDADEMLAALKAESDGKTGTEGDGKTTGTGDGKTGDGKTGTEGDSGKTGDGKGGGDDKGSKLPPSGRPTEKLTAGAVPGSTSEKSPAQLAEEILKSGF